ncbi:hypothetical protein EXE10_20620 [Acinetobacter sp. WCHAc060033]|uniref:hypothetical protein n=1 Tax=Acinetobacter sp. WCHAc060033 TaxID=2518624 RepID=UPI001022E965|nr:hypothetical protein [Acinetobacter sp. WCHAc060033]RZG74149.1 hypothetical protein EXE10_20620 [Acinetobacter sp. WCHAc060033]
MEFPENIAQQIGSDSVGATRAWRHQMICKLIDAGVTNPGEIKHSVDSLYEFVVSPIKKAQEAVVDNKDQEKEFIKTNIIDQQMNGAHLLNRLINQADLNQDQLDEINLFLNPYSLFEVKKV